MPSACRDLLYLRLKLFSPVTLLIRKIIYIVVGMNDGHEWLFKSQQVRYFHQYKRKIPIQVVCSSPILTL